MTLPPSDDSSVNAGAFLPTSSMVRVIHESGCGCYLVAWSSSLGCQHRRRRAIGAQRRRSSSRRSRRRCRALERRISRRSRPAKTRPRRRRAAGGGEAAAPSAAPGGSRSQPDLGGPARRHAVDRAPRHRHALRRLREEDRARAREGRRRQGRQDRPRHARRSRSRCTEGHDARTIAKPVDRLASAITSTSCYASTMRFALVLVFVPAAPVSASASRVAEAARGRSPMAARASRPHVAARR